MGRWIAGVLAAVITTVAAGLILNAFPGGQETFTVPSTEVAEPTDAEPSADAAQASVNEPPAQLLITSYVWEDAAGWIEHASWMSGTSETAFVPVLSAWNGTPDYPALTVRFDDFMTSDSVDTFDAGPLSSIWQVDKIGEDGLVRGASAESTGTTVTIDDRQLLVRLTEGTATSTQEKRVDLFHTITLESEFDISVQFSLEDEFYSLASGGLSLTVVCTACESFQAGITLLGNSYQSHEVADSEFRTLAGTPAMQLDGRLRLRGTKVDS